MNLAATLPLAELAGRCATETDNYARRQPNDPQFCFELLRRAFAEGSSEALTHVFRTYERLVTNWVYSNSRFMETSESAEYFVDLAFSNFYFALRGPRFAQFATPAHVLAYLRACVSSAILQYLRDQRPTDLLPTDGDAEPGYTPDLNDDIAAAELWEYILTLLPDDRSRLMAHCAMVLQMRPREIAAAYPRIWATAREATVMLYRVREILRDDPELRRRAGRDEVNR